MTGVRPGPGDAAALANATWTELADAAHRSVLAIPLGATEQHGPHLPLASDTMIAVALSERLAAARPHVMVAPALPYGSSGEHQGFAGTLSIGQAAVELVVLELVRSADAFAGVVLVSAHGGNAKPVARAVATLQSEGRQVMAWGPRLSGGDAHAGRTETSLVLALDPTAVRPGADAQAGNTEPITDLLPQLRAGGVAAVSANGVLGDPAGASAAEGRRMLDDLTLDLVTAVDKWQAGW